MAKAMTKSQIVAAVAEKTEISKKQAGIALEALSALAYKNAKNGFTVPGLGKLVLVNRKARMGRRNAINWSTGPAAPARLMLKAAASAAGSESAEATRASARK